MLFGKELHITTMSSQQIADDIQHFYDERRPDGPPIPIEFTDAQVVKRYELRVRPRPDQQVFTMADGTEAVNCTSEGGDEITVFIPKEDRGYEPALVLYTQHRR